MTAGVNSATQPPLPTGIGGSLPPSTVGNGPVGDPAAPNTTPPSNAGSTTAGGPGCSTPPIVPPAPTGCDPSQMPMGSVGGGNGGTQQSPIQGPVDAAKGATGGSNGGGPGDATQGVVNQSPQLAEVLQSLSSVVQQLTQILSSMSSKSQVSAGGPPSDPKQAVCGGSGGAGSMTGCNMDMSGTGGSKGGTGVDQSTQMPPGGSTGGSNGGAPDQKGATGGSKGGKGVDQSTQMPPGGSTGGSNGGSIEQKGATGGSNGGTTEQRENVDQKKKKKNKKHNHPQHPDHPQHPNRPPNPQGGNGGPKDKAPIDPSITPPGDPGQFPPYTGGSNGGPGQVPPFTGGSNGGPGQFPPYTGGSNGGPGQVPWDPTQSPIQQSVDDSNVMLSNKDSRYSATLTSANGNSIEIWGDPHVVINLGGKEEKFDIGYGPGSVTLSDGTIVSWETYLPGEQHQFVLKSFTVNGPRDEFDHTVQTGDGRDESELKTSLNDAELSELADILRTYEGPMNKPLKARMTQQ